MAVPGPNLAPAAAGAAPVGSAAPPGGGDSRPPGRLLFPAVGVGLNPGLTGNALKRGSSPAAKTRLSASQPGPASQTVTPPPGALSGRGGCSECEGRGAGTGTRPIRS